MAIQKEDQIKIILNTKKILQIILNRKKILEGATRAKYEKQNKEAVNMKYKQKSCQ